MRSTGSAYQVMGTIEHRIMNTDYKKQSPITQIPSESGRPFGLRLSHRLAHLKKSPLSLYPTKSQGVPSETQGILNIPKNTEHVSLFPSNLRYINLKKRSIL